MLMQPIYISDDEEEPTQIGLPASQLVRPQPMQRTYAMGPEELRAFFEMECDWEDQGHTLGEEMSWSSEDEGEGELSDLFAP